MRYGCLGQSVVGLYMAHKMVAYLERNFATFLEMWKFKCTMTLHLEQRE